MNIWEKWLSACLRRSITHGALVVRYASGHVESYGTPETPAVTIELRDRRLARELVCRPSVALGEAYMDGRLIVEHDDLYGLIERLLVNQPDRRGTWPARFLCYVRAFGRRLSQFNPERRARRNVAHHYDLSEDLYALFLDPDRQYSCAYFRQSTDTLEDAQQAKKDLIAAKLLLKPGQRVLDIGCGWGGLALHLAKTHGVQVTGITLSAEQLRVARTRAQAAGAVNTRFLLQDYRHVRGPVDRIVSVGMFEHVGRPHYEAFFAKVRDSLTDDGVALIHTIGRSDGPAATDPWIAKYIFPGGGVPALSEVTSAIERTGLVLTDLEVWRLHYAATLRAWRARFEANRDRIRQIYDERFCRMWRFYLIVSELAFRHAGLVVFQLQLAKRQDAVPLTRDYLTPKDLSDAMAESA